MTPASPTRSSHADPGAETEVHEEIAHDPSACAPERQPNHLTFFLDRNLGRGVPMALRDSGWAVELHDDHFPQDAKDVDLFPEVARRDWAFVTQDARIRYRTTEKEAWLRAGLRVFVDVTANLGAEETVAVLQKARRRMEKVAAEVAPPFIFRIAKDGLLRRIDVQARAAGHPRQ